MLRTAVASYERKLKKEISNNKQKKQRRRKNKERYGAEHRIWPRGKNPVGEKMPWLVPLIMWLSSYSVGGGPVMSSLSNTATAITS